MLVACAGCGSSGRRSTTTTAHPAAIPTGLRVGVVGPLRIDVQGVSPQHGTLAQVADDALVVVDARTLGIGAVASSARAHPSSHFALVGASARAEHIPNLAGIVLRESEAAYLAGVAAGLTAAEAGGSERVAWVGPEERRLAAAFGRGVRAAAAGVGVLHQWSRSVPALCKEAALTAIGRGALVIMAHGGLCADAAEAGAHEQNVPALRLGDFLLPSVAAALVARDAAGGVFHGGEDVVFGAATGAVGVGTLDPRIGVTVTAQVRAAAQDLAAGGGG